MPWKDDSKADPARSTERGPWETPGAAVAPPPKPAPRPWDDGGPVDLGAGSKRPRLPPLRRPRAPSDPATGGRAPRPKPVAPRRLAARNLGIGAKGATPADRAASLEALKRHLSSRLAARFDGPRGRRLRLALGLGAGLGLACGWLAGGVYRVGPDETAVVQRFGAFVGETGPGLHYHLPWPIGRVRRLPVGAPRSADGTDAADAVDATVQMLAADGAPVQVSYSVAWRVSDPRAYLFHVADAPDLLASLSTAAVRRAVGAAPSPRLLSGDRGAVDAAATAELQRSLDRLGAGVAVTGVEVRGVDAADAAQGGAANLAAAGQDARAAQADAAAYRDRVVAQARGEAAKGLAEAQGVADQEIAQAKGEADRFSALDAAYRKAPGPTRERLYDETMERVLKAANKVVVDVPKGSSLSLPASVVPQHDAGAPSPPSAAAASATPAAGATSAGPAPGAT